MKKQKRDDHDAVMDFLQKPFVEGVMIALVLYFGIFASPNKPASKSPEAAATSQPAKLKPRP